MPKHNTSFSTEIPGLQISWDATCLTSLKRCFYLYAREFILQQEPIEENISMKFGIVFHKAMESYIHATIDGADHIEAQALAVRTCHRESGSYDEHGWIVEIQSDGIILKSLFNPI